MSEVLVFVFVERQQVQLLVYCTLIWYDLESRSVYTLSDFRLVLPLQWTSSGTICLRVKREYPF